MTSQQVQVIALANCFELVHWEICRKSNMSSLALTDNYHTGQKSAYWTAKGKAPTVVVSPRALSAEVIHTFGICHSRPRPKFICPTEKSSSVIQDLLDDGVALAQLLDGLDRTTPVVLLPYIHTAQVERLADWLSELGYELYDFSRIAPLVRALCDKIYAHRELFMRNPLLADIRPQCEEASTLEELKCVADNFQSCGISHLVIKSANSVGGAGTFFVSTSSVAMATSLGQLLNAEGIIEPCRTPPFLVEEHIPSVSSPTVDIYVERSGDVSITGIALQRLASARYYTGFHYAPEMQRTRWFTNVAYTSIMVGKELAGVGYHGPANVDYVVLPNETIRLIEINPRRSALFDGFEIAARKYGAWNLRPISAADYVTCNSASSTRDVIDIIESVACGEDIHIVADAGLSSDSRWVGLWASTSSASSEALLGSCVRLLSGRSMRHLGTQVGLPLRNKCEHTVVPTFEKIVSAQGVLSPNFA